MRLIKYVAHGQNHQESWNSLFLNSEDMKYISQDPLTSFNYPYFLTNIMSVNIISYVRSCNVLGRLPISNFNFIKPLFTCSTDNAYIQSCAYNYYPILKNKLLPSGEKFCQLQQIRTHLHRVYQPDPSTYDKNCFFKVFYPEDGKYTIKRLKLRGLGGRDPDTGRVIFGKVGGGSKRHYRWVLFDRCPPDSMDPLEERIAGGASAIIARKKDNKVIIQATKHKQYAIDPRCLAVVGKVSMRNKPIHPIGSPQRLRWLKKRPGSGLWQRKDGRYGRKLKRDTLEVMEPKPDPSKVIILTLTGELPDKEVIPKTRRVT
ncbi:39S ribosomal protein L2, mitochondrial [Armadillidium vulgare]|nr:39S ribosomal protein L2, mitochondrial [Armadillidium vulgare]